MDNRLLAGLALLTTASSVWGYQLQADYQPPNQPLLESAGVQTVTVSVQRESNDPEIQCVLDVTVAAGPFASPPPDAATANVDYTPTTATTTVSFADSDLAGTVITATFDVPVTDDSLAETTQTFAAVVTNVVPVDCGVSPVLNIAGEGVVPIFDDDPGNLVLAVDQPVISVDEAAGAVSLGVTLSGSSSVEGAFSVAVDWTLVAGSAGTPEDFGGATSGTLFFDETTPTATVTIPIVDDAVLEGPEAFDLQLANASGERPTEEPVAVALAADTTTVQIVDDDDPGTVVFANLPYRANETDQAATITLLRQGGSAGPLTVFYITADGTATDGEDYQGASGSVSWADGEVGERAFTVAILDDTTTEGDETVLVRTSTDADFAQFDETTLTLVDDESAATTSFATSEISADENGTSIVLSLVRGGSTAGAVSVDFATEDGTAVAGEDYVAAAGTVSWADGDGADKTVTIQLLQDSSQEAAEDFLVVLSNVTGNAVLGGIGTITVTIAASDVPRDIGGIANLTPNQRALATWFDQTCPRLAALPAPTPGQQSLNQVCAIVRDTTTDDATVRQALDEINPEELLVTAFNALRLTAVQHGNVAQRLNALRAGARGIDLAGLELEINGEVVAGSALQAMFDSLVGGGASADENVWGRWGGFVNGRFSSGDKNRTDNEAGFDFDLYAVSTGVDYRIRDNFIIGVSAGFGSVDSDFDRGDGGVDIDSWNASAYLTYFRNERFYIDALATYGRNDYDSVRNVSLQAASGGFAGTARGETDGTQYSVGFGSGWDFNRGALTFGPHVGGYYFDVDVDGFQETGLQGLELDIGSQTTSSLTINAGAHVSYALLTDWGVLVPNFKIDWVHEFENASEALAFSFVNDPFAGDPSDPSPSITLRSDRPDSDYFIWSVGTSAQFVFGVSGFVSFQSFAGYRNVDVREWSAGLRWEKTW